MRLVLSLAAVALVALSAPALAFQEEADEVVCKRSDAPATGSNIRKRAKVCKKASEWKALERQNDETLRRVNDKMRGGGAPTPPSLGAN